MGTSLGLELVSFLFLLRLALFSSHFFFSIFYVFLSIFRSLILTLDLFLFFPLSWDLLPGSQSSYFPTLRTGKLENSNRISIFRMKSNGRVGVKKKKTCTML